MLMTKRKPASVGEILSEEFMEPMGLTQGTLADAMGVQRKPRQRAVQRPSQRDRSDRAHPCPRVVQRGSDLLETMHSPRERERINRA